MSDERKAFVSDLYDQIKVLTQQLDELAGLANIDWDPYSEKFSATFRPEFMHIMAQIENLQQQMEDGMMPGGGSNLSQGDNEMSDKRPLDGKDDKPKRRTIEKPAPGAHSRYR